MDSLIHAIEKGLEIKDKIINTTYEARQTHHHHTGKKYAVLKQECISRRSLFSDPDFPAKKIRLMPQHNKKNVQWKRPQEISLNPRFFVDGASRFDLAQGALGDCWLIATIANLTLNKDLFNQVVPPGQEFDKSYAGIFHFRFWCFGHWIEIVIDDFLPTYNGKLIYVTSQDANEFWPSLLEKAYAKLQGSYLSLDGGITSDAMVHFTGGVTETILLRNCSNGLFDVMNKGIERGSLLAGSITADSKVKEQRLSNGLVRGHAYSITNVCWCNRINRPGKPAQLIRMRNPWGGSVEWRGPWSDRSKEWLSVSSEEKRMLGVQFKRDGEFWISFEDFRKHFDFLEMTNVNLQSLTEHDAIGRLKHMWKVERFTGSWVKGVSAGGNSKNPRTFICNPKFSINLTEADDGNNDGYCTLIVALLQRPRSTRHVGAREAYSIGFSLYRVTSNLDILNLSRKFFNDTNEMEGIEKYTVGNQVSHRFQLPVGQYCLVPTTKFPGEEADFIVRIFTEKAMEIRETSSQNQFDCFNNLHINDPLIALGSQNQGMTCPPLTAFPMPPAENTLVPVPPMAPPLSFPPVNTTSSYSAYPPMRRTDDPLSTPYPAPSPINTSAFPHHPYHVPAAETFPTSPYPIPPTVTTNSYPYTSQINDQMPSSYPISRHVNTESFSPYASTSTTPIPYLYYPPTQEINAVSIPLPYDQKTPSELSYPHSPNPSDFPYPHSSNPLWTGQSAPSIESTENSTVNWKALHSLLNSTFSSEFIFDGFSKTACRSMIALMDDENSGELDDDKMSKLLTSIEVWKANFMKYDLEKSGLLGCEELRAALTSSGIIISDVTMSSILTTYGDNGSIDFDDYIICQLRLNQAIKSYFEKDVTRIGKASFTLEELMENCCL